MVSPGLALALLRAVLCSFASSALGELPRVLLPLAAAKISTLPTTPRGFVLSVVIAVVNRRPVVDISAVEMSHGEFFHQREDVDSPDGFNLFIDAGRLANRGRKFIPAGFIVPTGGIPGE